MRFCSAFLLFNSTFLGPLSPGRTCALPADPQSQPPTLCCNRGHVMKMALVSSLSPADEECVLPTVPAALAGGW